MLTIDNSKSPAGLQLFGSNDPTFIARFPQQTNGATFGTLGTSAPYSVLLTNDSGRPIYRVIVVYDLGNGIIRIEVLGGPQFAPGSANLIAPSVQLAQSLNSGKLNSSLTSAQQQEVQPVITLFDSRPSVKVYIDGIIWGDTMKFEGPNASHAFDYMQQQAKAKTDFLALVTPLTGPALLATLQKIQRPTPTASMEDEDFYGQMMFQLAQVSINMIGTGNGEAFWRSTLKPEPQVTR